MKSNSLAVILLTLALPVALVFGGTYGLDHLQTDFHNKKVIHEVSLTQAKSETSSLTMENLFDLATAAEMDPSELRYRDLSRAYEHGKEIHFYNKKDYENWLTFYIRSYSMKAQDSSFSASYLGTDLISITQKTSAVYDREKEINSVVQTFGVKKQEGTDREIVASTSDQVHSYLTYSLDYLDSSLASALADHKGVCWHYSRCLYILLNLKGIPTRVVLGYLRNVPHAWNECFVDGTWQMVDPTGVNGGFVPDSLKSNYLEDSIVTESTSTLPF